MLWHCLLEGHPVYNIFHSSSSVSFWSFRNEFFGNPTWHLLNTEVIFSTKTGSSPPDDITDVFMFADGHSAVEDRRHRVRLEEEEGGWWCRRWCICGESWRGSGSIRSQWLVLPSLTISQSQETTVCRVPRVVLRRCLFVSHRLAEVKVLSRQLVTVNTSLLSTVLRAWNSLLGYCAKFVFYQ